MTNLLCQISSLCWTLTSFPSSVYLLPDVVFSKFPLIFQKLSTLLKMLLLLMILDPSSADDHRAVQLGCPALAGKTFL